MEDRTVIEVCTTYGTFEVAIFDSSSGPGLWFTQLAKMGDLEGFLMNKMIPGVLLSGLLKKQSYSLTSLNDLPRSNMSHSGAGIVSCQLGLPGESFDRLFISISSQPKMNLNYRVIGRLLSGIDVLSKVCQEDVDEKYQLEAPLVFVSATVRQLNKQDSLNQSNREQVFWSPLRTPCDSLLRDI